MKGLIVLTSVCLLLGGCVAPAPKADDPYYAPVLPRTPLPANATSGAIYQAGFESNLYDDRKAFRIGDIITITQYLRPSKLHHPIDRWVKPQEFVQWSQRAEEIGFQGVMAGPLVRSSYRAGKLYAQAMQRLGRTLPENLAHLAGEKTARQEASAVVAQMS